MTDTDITATVTAKTIWGMVRERPRCEVKGAPGCQWCRQKRGARCEPGGFVLCTACVKYMNLRDEARIAARRAPLEGETPTKEWQRAQAKRVNSRGRAPVTGEQYENVRRRALERYYNRPSILCANALPYNDPRGIL